MTDVPTPLGADDSDAPAAVLPSEVEFVDQVVPDLVRRGVFRQDDRGKPGRAHHGLLRASDEP